MPRRKLSVPDSSGRFGRFGGRFVPETVISALDELADAFARYSADRSFQKELRGHLHTFVGRPTPLYFAERLSREIGRGQIYFKREDLNHTGAHKINNAVGQILLALRMGKKRIIAETGAGQHGLATATVCARFGLECVIYMGAEDVRRQAPNVEKIRLLGATVIPVTSGSQTLKDATNEALRDWVTNIASTFYIIGSVVGPHPYPLVVREFQSVIGIEIKTQARKAFSRLPQLVIACVGGGSNALGAFHAFRDDRSVRLIGIEAAGKGTNTSEHAATLSMGSPGVLHGSYSYLLADDDGQVTLPHSISSGLDYPGVGPEHSWLKETGRVRYEAITDKQALEALRLTARLEGIIPALETSHAIAWLFANPSELKKKELVVVCLSGRGDKDMPILLEQSKP